jgi:hypothetical protein
MKLSYKYIYNVSVGVKILISTSVGQHAEMSEYMSVDMSKYMSGRCRNCFSESQCPKKIK